MTLLHFFSKVLKEARLVGDNFDETLIIDTDCIPMCTEVFRSVESVQDPEFVEDLLTFDDKMVSISITVLNDDLEESVSSSCTGDQSNSHLTKKERELLQSYENDSAFRGLNGRIKWTEVAVNFASMIDDVNVFPRSNKRLQSSLKSLKEIAKKRITSSATSNPSPIISSEIDEEPRLSSSSFAAQVIPSSIALSDLNSVAQFHNTTIASSTCVRTKRKDNLDELERIFVQDFGKNNFTHNQTVSGDKLLRSYHKKFPTLTSDSQTLKSCWINYKKSASFLRFSDK